MIQICKSKILPVLYRCESWSLTVREEHKVKLFENRALKEEYLDLRRRKWQEAGEDCMMRNFITCTLHQILLG